MKTATKLSSSKLVFLLPFKPFNNSIGKPFTELTVVDSTNNYAMGLVRKGLALHGAAWFAHHQTAGKGQRGKLWQTQPRQNIILTVVLNALLLNVSSQFSLSAAMALATHDLLSSYAVNDIKIKWPNDIYWRDRKAAGLLIENVIRGNIWQWALVGIGVNINQTKFENALINPVSLKQITGNNYNTVTLAKELCKFIETRYNQLINENFETIMKEYNNVLYKRNETVNFKNRGAVLQTTIKQVNANGQLETEDSLFRRFNFGEVEWLIT